MALVIHTLFGGAEFIWTNNLDLGNLVICRATVDSPATPSELRAWFDSAPFSLRGWPTQRDPRRKARAIDRLL